MQLTKEIWIDAPPEKAYRYLVEPELTVCWFGEESWNEPHAGGLYRVSGRGNVVRGEFVELDPGRRVVHTWGSEGPNQIHAPGTTTVEWDLEGLGGGTRLRIRHSGLTEEGVERHGGVGITSYRSSPRRLQHEVAERVRGISPRP